MQVNQNMNEPVRNKKPTSYWLAIIFGILLGVSAFANLILFVALVSKVATSMTTGGFQDKRYLEKYISGDASSNNKILLVPIKGVIMSGAGQAGFWGESLDMVQSVAEVLEIAQKDNNIKAIILDVNSPGGSVTASDNIHKSLVRFKEKRPDVIIVAYFGELAASGGYYVSMPAGRIVAHPTSITGSIGVIAKLLNIEGLFDKIGLKEIAVKSADKKDMLSSTRTMTEEERAILQSMINEMYERFLGIVVAGRPNMSKEEIRKLADGRVYTGEQALQKGLVDELGDKEDTYEITKKIAKISDAKIVQFERRHNIWDLFEMKASAKPVDFAGELKSMILEKNTPRMYYLWQME